MKISYNNNSNIFDPFDKELETKGKEGKPFYYPHPADLSDVALPSDVEKNMEKIAEHIHEVWAFDMVEKGWVWGDKIDEVKLTHPELVRYEELKDSQKNKYRKIAGETIKYFIKFNHS